MTKDIIIFGAGELGRSILKKCGDRVDFLIDNNEKLYGHTIDGVMVKSVAQGVEKRAGHTIIIASKYWDEMVQQLKEYGVKEEEYIFYTETSLGYRSTDDLIVNPYLNESRDVSEEEWNKSLEGNHKIKMINELVEQLQGKELMFDHVEIETVNRCNGSCSFCPVSKQRDTREYKMMTDELFERIILQLADINYSGKLALFSNNEPFLDPDILKRHKYAREKLPNARMHLFTNGTLLTIERFQELMLYLDELIIDNYQQDLRLIKPCREIAAYCERHPELKKRVTIELRKPHEILTNRGGDAPNRKELISYKKDRCILPYRQLIIRPDGKVSLCCNDPLGKCTLGDLEKDSILEVWNNQRFRTVREALYKGRENWLHCKYCDVFIAG